MSTDLDSSSAAYPDLLSEARGGCEVALAKLLDSDRDYLMLVAEAELDSVLRVKASQSDLVQETMLEAQQSFVGFRGSSSFQWQQWLRAILKNNIRDLRRRYIETEKRNLRREVENADGEQAGHSTDSPSQRFARQEEIQLLEKSLNGLPDHYQQVLRLRFWQQLSYDEIAVETNSTAEAVRKILYRAVEALVNVFEFRNQ